MSAAADMTVWTTAVTALAAIVGAIAIPIQLVQSRKLQSASAASQMYQAFLREALSHSELLNQNDDGVSQVAKRLASGDGTAKDLQFDWLMYYALECFESGLAVGTRSWRDRARVFFAQYPKYFGSEYYLNKVSKQFQKRTNELVREAVKNSANILNGKL